MSIVKGVHFLFNNIGRSTNGATKQLCFLNHRHTNFLIASHKDFVCIGAANTVGTGADRMYSGRNKLDGSTLDRFMVGKVMVDYDRNVEEQLCPDANLRNKLWKIRDAINSHRLERAMSTRFLIDAYDMQEAGWDEKEILDAYFTGWREDEINKVKTSANI